MNLLSFRSNARRGFSLWVGFLFITLFMLECFAAQGQEPVIFQLYKLDYPLSERPFEVSGASYAPISDIEPNNVTCLGDITPTESQDWVLSTFYAPELSLLNGTSRNASRRCLYNTPVKLTQDNGSSVTSFSTMFEAYISPGRISTTNPTMNNSLQGLAFIMANDEFSQGAGGGYLGWLNNTTNDQASGHNFALEIDFFQDQEFHDPAGVHVGVDNNSLTSFTTDTIEGLSDFLTPRTYYPDADDSLPTNPQDFVLVVWADYDAPTKNLSVYVSWFTANSDPSVIGNYFVVSLTSKPLKPSISTTIDLTDIFSRDGTFIGFSSSGIGDYYISTWTFNSNGPAPDVRRDADGLPLDTSVKAEKIVAHKGQREKTMIVAATVPSVIVFVLGFIIIMQYRRTSRQNTRLTALKKRYQIEEDLLDGGPQKFRYKELARATKEFDAKTKLGEGGFGSVYKGSLVLKQGDNPTDVAVKRISASSKQGEREFLAEVKIIGQAQHRNLVRLLGWCHEKDELLLVYDYMPNRSVHDHLYKKTQGGPGLTWTRRMMIFNGVAKALAFLHEEWEHRVIHRDVKSSNVMLDRDFNARLGDFGLALLSKHDQTIPFTEAMAGTYGYIAPELHHTCTPTEKTDVYSFGATMLEIATGRKPLLSQEDKESSKQTLLVDWVWGLYRDNALLEAADPALNNSYDPGEMEMFLEMALLCSHPNPDERPNMREVISMWKGSRPLPQLPLSKPVPVFAAIDSDGWRSLTIDSEVQSSDSSVPEKQQGRNSSRDSTLRYTMQTTWPLPF